MEYGSPYREKGPMVKRSNSDEARAVWKKLED
jgi:hypothetical protein